MKTSVFFKAFIVALALATHPLYAAALSLDEAKSKGLVGEQVSGYLDAVSSTPEVDKLIKEINAKRREKYQQIAQQNGTALGTVETLAGKKAIESSPSGSFVKSPQGTWIRK